MIADIGWVAEPADQQRAGDDDHRRNPDHSQPNTEPGVPPARKSTAKPTAKPVPLGNPEWRGLWNPGDPRDQAVRGRVRSFGIEGAPELVFEQLGFVSRGDRMVVRHRVVLPSPVGSTSARMRRSA